MSEQEEKVEAPAVPDDEVISVVDWDGVMEETLTDEQYVKLVVDLKPITKEQADRLVEGVVVELSEEQLAFAREWVAEMLMSPESVKMMGEYMDRKAEAQRRLWGSPLEGEEERISITEAEERAIDEWLEITKSPLLAAVKVLGVPLNEAEQAEALKKYGRWQDDKLELWNGLE